MLERMTQKRDSAKEAGNMKGLKRMKTVLLAIAFSLAFLCTGQALAVPTSTSINLTSNVLDLGSSAIVGDITVGAADSLAGALTAEGSGVCVQDGGLVGSGPAPDAPTITGDAAGPLAGWYASVIFVASLEQSTGFRVTDYGEVYDRFEDDTEQDKPGGGTEEVATSAGVGLLGLVLGVRKSRKLRRRRRRRSGR